MRTEPLVNHAHAQSSMVQTYLNFNRIAYVSGILLFLLTSSAVLSGRPIVTSLMDEKSGREINPLTDTQVKEIVRFIKTIPNIDHRIQEVDATSTPQVVVHTGVSRDKRGDVLHIEKHNGHWFVVKRAKWKMIIEPSRGGTPPFVYEKQYQRLWKLEGIRYIDVYHGLVKTLDDNIYYYQDSLGRTSHLANNGGKPQYDRATEDFFARLSYFQFRALQHWQVPRLLYSPKPFNARALPIQRYPSQTQTANDSR